MSALKGRDSHSVPHNALILPEHSWENKCSRIQCNNIEAWGIVPQIRPVGKFDTAGVKRFALQYRQPRSETQDHSTFVHATSLFRNKFPKNFILYT